LTDKPSASSEKQSIELDDSLIEDIIETPRPVKDDEIICIDSDDDEDQASPLPPPPPPPVVEPEQNGTKRKSPTAASERAAKRRVPPQTPQKECINHKCPRNDDDEFLPAYGFVLNFYYVAKKTNKSQFVCDSCHDKAVLKYEELCQALSENRPLCKVELLEKPDIVEIADSDEENEEPAESKSVDEQDKVVWNPKVEAEVEEILQSYANKYDIKQQQKWQEQMLKKKLDKNDDKLKNLNEELKALEQISRNMYNSLYAVNKPD